MDTRGYGSFKTEGYAGKTDKGREFEFRNHRDKRAGDFALDTILILIKDKEYFFNKNK